MGCRRGSVSPGRDCGSGCSALWSCGASLGPGSGWQPHTDHRGPESTCWCDPRGPWDCVAEPGGCLGGIMALLVLRINQQVYGACQSGCWHMPGARGICPTALSTWASSCTPISALVLGKGVRTRGSAGVGRGPLPSASSAPPGQEAAGGTDRAAPAQTAWADVAVCGAGESRDYREVARGGQDRGRTEGVVGGNIESTG